MTEIADQSVAERRRQALLRWNDALQAREAAAQAGAESREQQLEARRRLDALRRTDEAVSRWAERMASERPAGRPRVVVAHRQAWLRTRLVDCLAEHGMQVVAEVEDGADTLGVAVVGQPDLVVLEDRLPSVTVRELLQGVQEFSPDTLAVVQVDGEDKAGALLDAGAAAVVSRHLPPAELCARVAALLS
ncbi:MAG: response regulator [Mycobacteriales bacterium]